MHRTIWLAFVSVAALTAAEHRPLVPAPRNISYGTGQMRLEGIEIGFASSPVAEDRFAANALSAAIAEASDAAVPVRDGTCSGRCIVLKRIGPVSALPEKDETPGPDARESYRITIGPDGAQVVAKSSAGLFYAVETLRQMVEGRGREAVLPQAEVRDWPAMAYRGFMMDLSHGSIMREEEIERQLDFLARFKGNQYYFYSEAAIELKGYPLLNPKGRYSQAQVKRIIGYARERHIDVVPCVELYGHLHDLFRIERYADMAALEHGGDLNPTHPKTAALLKDWVGQLAALFPSPWMHVGLDEPFELEAAGTAAAGGIQPAELYRRHLDEVTKLVRAQGKRTLFWADIEAGARVFNKYPELIAQLPADVVPVPWYYAAKPDYTAWVEPFGKAHKPMMVAPGVTCWNEIFPDYTTTFTNIDGFIAAGRKHGAIGVINTGWTDDAQTMYRMARPGMAYGAAASWQAAPMRRATFFADYAAQMYPGDAGREVAVALSALSESRDLLAGSVGDDTMHRFWEDPLEPGRLKAAAVHKKDLRQSRLRAEDAMEVLMNASEALPGDASLPSLQLAAGMLDYLGMKHLYALDLADYFRRAGPQPDSKQMWLFLELETSFQDHSHIADLMDTVTSLKDDYTQAWKQEWTGYRSGTAFGRWDAEYEYWRKLQASIEEARYKYRAGDTFPSLESLRPKF